jgi:hypothetical protein
MALYPVIYNNLTHRRLICEEEEEEKDLTNNGT